MHDEAVYPDSHTFKPERFLDANGKVDRTVRDPGDIVFGVRCSSRRSRESYSDYSVLKFGRRICPGRHMAYSIVWITVASLLRVYNIEKVRPGLTSSSRLWAWISDQIDRQAKRPDGTIIEPPREWESSLVL